MCHWLLENGGDGNAVDIRGEYDAAIILLGIMN